MEEVRVALKTMAKKKAADERGIVVEMLQEGGAFMIQLIGELFSEIFQRKALAPESWKTSLVKVLFKKGDPKQPGNYRPITLLPILYKLFSWILCGRIRQTLEDAQRADQAGFCAGFRCCLLSFYSSSEWGSSNCHFGCAQLTSKRRLTQWNMEHCGKHYANKELTRATFVY